MGLKRLFKKLTGQVKAKPEYKGDGLYVRGKNTSFLDEPKFAAAWSFAEWGNREAWAKVGRVPDVRWRAHTCCFAAKRALNLDGDFVEFGVNAGLLSMTVCDYIDFGSLNRTFWLFDTFAGLPQEGLSGTEAKSAANRNAVLYQDVFEIAKRNFAKFDNAKLVRGALPGTISNAAIEKIAYLSIDLNSARYERECIEAVWDRVVVGATIVLDDYAFASVKDQYAMWNEFAKERGQAILTMPTGQGLMIKQ